MEKICSYIVSWGLMVKTTHKYDESNMNVADTQYETQNAVPSKCLGDRCAAWQDGRCHYRGG